MTKLTSLQTELLTAAAAADTGFIDMPDPRPAGLAGLIKQGFILITPMQGAGDRVLLTEAGRAVIAPPAPATKAKGTKARGATPAPREAPAVPEAKGKLGLLVSLLRRDGGASIEDLMTATGWQAHSVRGAMSTVKKKQGLEIVSEKTEAGRFYRIEGASA